MKGVMTSPSSESVLLSVSTAYIENHRNRGKFKQGEGVGERDGFGKRWKSQALYDGSRDGEQGRNKKCRRGYIDKIWQ